MLAPLLLMVSMSAAPSARVLYETKCLYCHSAVVTEAAVRTPAQWKKVVASMRRKAPLLIARGEARQLVSYLVTTLKLVPPPSSKPRAATVVLNSPAVRETAPPVEPPADSEGLPGAADDATSTEPSDENDRFEGHATELIERRCSKCHTLSRVYTKLDTLDRSLVTLRRMRLKPGSGISATDAATIERFLRTQFDTR
ncbi:MAG: photosystem P840 reaction-center cytochrome c-551 [Myxococcaceae bacterium]|nr:photosystem P840 reaction-center cytochrome c-551 [Myxococcaceae bacterium]